jgi:hypothetical protein
LLAAGTPPGQGPRPVSGMPENLPDFRAPDLLDWHETETPAGEIRD